MHTDWQWQRVCSRPPSPPSLCLDILSLPLHPPPPPPHIIISFSSLLISFCLLLHLHSDLFTGTLLVFEFVTCLSLGPVWAGWAGWTRGVLGVGPAGAPPPPAPALLTRRPASWYLRTTGDRWAGDTPLFLHFDEITHFVVASTFFIIPFFTTWISVLQLGHFTHQLYSWDEETQHLCNTRLYHKLYNATTIVCACSRTWWITCVSLQKKWFGIFT